MEHYKKRIHKQDRREIKTNFEAFDNFHFLHSWWKNMTVYTKNGCPFIKAWSKIIWKCDDCVKWKLISSFEIISFTNISYNFYWLIRYINHYFSIVALIHTLTLMKMLKTCLEDHKEHFTKWIDLYSCCSSIIIFITPCIPIDAIYPPS